MKALELTVYQVDATDPDMVVINNYWEYRPHSMVKRLTDAELAAEYWAPTWLTIPDADWDGDYAGTELKMKRRVEGLHRFAALPHYDEPQP